MIAPKWTGDVTSDEDMFRDKWRAKGLSEKQIGRKWQEFWEIEGYRDKLERQGLSFEEIREKIREAEAKVMRRRLQ